MQYVSGLRPEIFEWSRFTDRLATDIGVAADGNVWIVGTDARPGGFGVYRWSGRVWEPHNVGAARVEVAPGGAAWLITDSGTLLEPTDGEWKKCYTPNPVRDVAIGLDESVWIVAAPQHGPGRVLRRVDNDWVGEYDTPSPYTYPHDIPWVPADDDSYDLPHPGVSPERPIAVGVMANGLPWVVDEDGSIRRRVVGGWQRMPDEPASDIAIAPDGNVWIVGRDQRPGGFGPWRYYHGTDWDCYEGAAVRITAGPDGLPWTVDDAGVIHRQHVKL